jgi:serine/threonine protein kinase
MAPEILSSSSSCGMCDSSAADIWSFGITLIELLKGRPPLHYLSPSGAMATIPRSSPPRLESDDSRVSKQLRGLIHACLHDDPHKRPTAAFLLKACKSYFKQQVYSVPGALARLCQDNSTNGNETDDCDSKEEVSSGSRKEAKEASDTIYSQWDFDMSTFMGEEVICENSLTGDSERTDEGSVNIGVDVSESEAIEPQEITEEEGDRNKIDTSESESFETKPSRSKFKFSRRQSHLNLFDRTAPGGWKDKDVSILPIPRPTDAPDLSRPQFLKVREENSQDSEIELLMREYLRGEKGPGVRMKLKGLL